MRLHAGRWPEMPRQFFSSVFQNGDGTGIAGFRGAPADGSKRRDLRARMRQARDPAFEAIDRVGVIELQRAEHRIDELGRRRAAVEALAHQAEHTTPDPVPAAFIADRLAPAADPMGLSRRVPRPGHRTGTGEDQDARPAREGADLRRIDVVQHPLRDRAEGRGDRTALIGGNVLDLAIGGQCRTDTGEAVWPWRNAGAARRGRAAKRDCPSG